MFERYGLRPWETRRLAATFLDELDAYHLARADYAVEQAEQERKSQAKQDRLNRVKPAAWPH